MRWTPGGVSSDVEDRRGSSGGGGFGFGGMHIGIGGAVILLVLSLLFHKNFFALLGAGDQTAPQQQSQPVQETPAEHQKVEFVSFVLDDAQKTWEQTLPGYRHAKLDLFRNSIQSACGFAQSASGPFYCPEDEKVYIDLGFYDELREKFGAPGDFAQAYVIAHEIGHHVQKLQGIEQQVHDAMASDRSQRSALSVSLELQADCYAGVWGHSTQQRGIIDNADIEQGLNAAAAIGDDRLQRQAGRTVNPETFTHGSSKQRVEWFRRGLQSGRVEDCNTFRQ
jgi:predicted metalloprotease